VGIGEGANAHGLPRLHRRDLSLVNLGDHIHLAQIDEGEQNLVRLDGPAGQDVGLEHHPIPRRRKNQLGRRIGDHA
jgi:hypothetical protein